MDYDLQKLRAELIRDEGLRLTAYRDSLGFLTIGIGHLIKKGESFGVITKDQAISILEEDIKDAERKLDSIFPGWRKLDDVRQRTFVNLSVNLGYKLADFKRFLHSAKSEDWEKAADQLMQSRWYKQVKLRGPRIVHAIRTGTEWSGV